MKPKHSYKDTRGHLWVACSECNRGGNGDNEDAAWDSVSGRIDQIIEELQSRAANETYEDLEDSDMLDIKEVKGDAEIA